MISTKIFYFYIITFELVKKSIPDLVFRNKIPKLLLVGFLWSGLEIMMS